MRLEITRFIRILFTPPAITLCALMLSFSAWLMPSLGIFEKGFDSPEPFFDKGILYITAWYGSVVFFSLLGFSLIPKRRISSPLIRALSLEQPIPYLVFSATAAVATLYLAATLIHRVGLPEILHAILDGNANYLKNVLYSDYSVGLFSLRYLSIFSAALACFRFSKYRKFSLLDISNLICLLITVTVSSRLSLIAALLVFLVLHVFNNERIYIRPVKILLLTSLIFFLLSAFNYSRNFRYYQETESHGFISSNVSQILAYLSTPFQTSLALGNHPLMMQQNLDFNFLAQVDNAYMTNSSMVQLIEAYGFMSAWAILITTAFLGGAAAAFLLKLRHTYFFLIYGFLLYCFAELWRIYLFNAGISLTLYIMGALIPFISLILISAIPKKRIPSPLPDTPDLPDS